MAIKPLNSVAGFSVGEVPTSIILANGDIKTINFTANGISNLGPVSNVIITGGSADQVLKTDGAGNLSWSSGSILANGYSNVSIPTANGNVIINANGGTDQQWTFGTNGVLTVPGNIFISNTSPSVGILTDNLYYSNGQPWDLQEAAGSNTQIQFNDGNNNFGASANFTYDDATRLLTVLGNAQFNNANLGNLVTANFVNVSTNVNVTNTMQAGNVRTDNLLYANGNPWDLQEAAGSNTQIQYNDGLNNFGASANFTYDDAVSNLTVVGNIIATRLYGNITAPGSNTEVIFNDDTVSNAVANFTYSKIYNSGGGQLNVGNTFGGEIITDNVYASYGNLGNLDVTTAIVVGGNISITGAGGDITMSGGNITGVNNISANSANFTGNVSAANLVGALANGTSNVKVFNNANVEISINGTANIATIASTGLYVVGEINTTAGNMLSNGNITANGFINGANANITGEAQLGSVLTSNITAPVGTITINAAGIDQNIILAPTGNGTIDTGLHRITHVGAPVDPDDAVTKEYADSIGQGLFIHTPVTVEANVALNATYVQGGTTQTTTDITGGKTITFSTNHGLSVNDGIVWTNSFNGIVGGEAYWVQTVPALNQITVRDGYFGAEVITLTNGTGLTQASRANPGVGATLTNTGANAALVIDSVTMANGDRVLVYNQASTYENGVYAVTDKGNISAAWVLTRSSDMNKYIPKSPVGLGSGSYFFVSEGVSAAGESYVMTQPEGEVVIGTDSIVFTQFQAAGSYTAGNGIAINGTVISANVDLETTDIVSGNIVVKTSANLTTPNIGDATFSSLTWNTLSNGNVTANNLSISSYANITLDLTVDGAIQANGSISSNANVNGNNAYFTNFLDVGANLVANNITANYEFSTTNANISSNLTTNNATVNLELSGNTANFSGNVVVPNLTVNLELAGNTANFSGNIKALNTNAGNLLTANFANIASNITTSNLTVNLELSGNTANFSSNIDVGGILTDNYYYANGSPVDFQQAAGSNTQLQYNNNNDFGASANLTFNSTTNMLGVVGDANVSNAVIIGNTTVTSNTVTTNTTTANQTIASIPVSGITGIEYLVKGIDSVGSKYSVATVQAVTDGTNVDYSTFGTVNLGGYTGSLGVGISGGFLRLQVTPASTNATVWTTQYRII